MRTSDAPEDVVHAVIEAAAVRQWGEVFKHIDDSDLPRWRRVTLSMLRHFERQPDADRIFAEWGAHDTSELELLPDAALFERWMKAFTLDARMRVAFGQTGPPAPPGVQRVVLGSVREGDDLAHVVYREIVAGGGSALRIATLRLAADGWKLRVDHDLLGVGSLHFGPPQPDRAGGA
jgi:hypothetical protein